MRWYDINGKKYESVTTILGDTTPQNWMLPYVKKHAREALLDIVENLEGEITEKDLKYCLDAHKRHSEVAMAFGSLVHSGAEVYHKLWDEDFLEYLNLLDEYVPNLLPMISTYFKALLREGIIVIKSEQTVWYDDGKIEYAGTLDEIVEIENELGILDIKTFTPKFKWKAFNGGKRALRVADTKEELEVLVKGKECEIRKVYDNKVPDKKDHWVQTEAYRRAYNWLQAIKAGNRIGKVQFPRPIFNRFILYLNKLDTSHYELVKIPQETNDEHWEVFKAQYTTHKFYK